MKSYLLAALVFCLGPMACTNGGATEDASEDVAPLAASNIRDLGTIAVGETKAASYTATPAYRSFSFTAKKDETVEFWVRSVPGNAVAQILRANGASLAFNDNASTATRDAHVVATLPEDGTYRIVFREATGKACPFSVEFASRTTPLTVGIGWNADLGRVEAHRVDPTTMQHTLISPISDVTATADTLLDRKAGTLYIRASMTDGTSRLVGIDAETGSLRTAPVFPPFSLDADGRRYHGMNFAAFQALPSGLVTITWNGEADREELRRVDPATLQSTLIAPIPGVTWTQGTFSDPEKSIVYVHGGGPDGVAHLIAISALTGSILSRSVMPLGTYDPVTQHYTGLFFGTSMHVMPGSKVIGLAWHGDDAREELHTIDPSTMRTKLLAIVPGVRNPGATYSAPMRGVIYFEATGEDLRARLLTLDAKSGAIRSAPLMPALTCSDPTRAQSCRGFYFTGGLHVVR